MAQWRGPRACACQRQDDSKEIQRINEVFKTGAKVEDFANSGEPRFATLDIKLYAAVLSVIRDGNRTLATKVAGMEDAALTKGNVMKGRQLVFLAGSWSSWSTTGLSSTPT